MDTILAFIDWLKELYAAIAAFIAGFDYDWAFEKEAE